MKNLFFFLLFTITFSLIGCGDSEEDAPADFMTAIVNGDAFEATNVSGFSDNTFNEELVLILGTQISNSVSIGLNIPTSIGTGFLDIAADDGGITFTDDISNGTTVFSTVGSINLTRNDTTENVLEGSFNFTAIDEDDATNVFNITGGEFKVNYL